jgi:predicted secreted protein
MEYLEFIHEFFSHIKCNHCQEFFKEDSIHLVRQEVNHIVVRIVCSHCGKNLGLAVIGIDKSEYNNSLKFSESSDDSPISMENEKEAITYDDVIQAHEFFSNLGDDWAKYLPKAN